MQDFHEWLRSQQNESVVGRTLGSLGGMMANSFTTAPRIAAQRIGNWAKGEFQDAKQSYQKIRGQGGQSVPVPKAVEELQILMKDPGNMTPQAKNDTFQLIRWLQQFPPEYVVVPNETGPGIVPPQEGDNKIQIAKDMFYCVAGINGPSPSQIQGQRNMQNIGNGEIPGYDPNAAQNVSGLAAKLRNAPPPMPSAMVAPPSLAKR